MARNRISLSFKGFEELAEKLDKAGGDLKKVTEKALITSKKIVEKNLDEVVIKPNFPSEEEPGQYSTGKTRDSIDRSETVDWNGTKASIKVGFDFKISGLTSVFLMYGTPRRKKSQTAKSPKIYNAVYGAKTKKQIAEAQEKIFREEINKIIG